MALKEQKTHFGNSVPALAFISIPSSSQLRRHGVLIVMLVTHIAASIGPRYIDGQS